MDTHLPMIFTSSRLRSSTRGRRASLASGPNRRVLNNGTYRSNNASYHQNVKKLLDAKAMLPPINITPSDPQGVNGSTKIQRRRDNCKSSKHREPLQLPSITNGQKSARGLRLNRQFGQ